MIIDLFIKWLKPAGGGERVAATLAEALLNAGHQVILNTVEPADLSVFKDVFGKDIGAAKVKVTSRILSEATSLGPVRRYVNLVNEFAERRSIRGDVFVDLSPSSCFGATYPRLPDIAYWTPPIDFGAYLQQLLAGPRRRAAFTPYAFLLLKLLDRMNEIPLNLVNSHYSERVIRKHYFGHYNAPMRVLYPPVAVKEWRPQRSARRRKRVISVARFMPFKRHDLQLQIVGSKVPLLMVGGARVLGERNTVRHLAQIKPPNVRLLVNQPVQNLKRLLWSSKVFLHTADNEPFGLSIVEAIAAGCVPVIRRSGGAAEIVPIPELTFTSTRGATEIVEKALAGDYDRYLPQLSARIAKFDESVFCREFLSAIGRVHN